MARPSPSPVARPLLAPEPAAPPRSGFALLVTSLRPEQWTKNLLVFAGALFGGRLLDAHAVGLALGAFAVVCAISGAVYLFNDLADREADAVILYSPLGR